MERREQAIAIWIGSTGNGRNPIVERVFIKATCRFCARVVDYGNGKAAGDLMGVGPQGAFPV